MPALSADDGPDGLRNPGTTAMPSGQALAATFDRALAYAYGQVVGSEARGEGFNEWLGPAVDIDRTPLAGRQPEAEGEDPFLAGNTSAQVILGAQSQHVISTLKHYTAYNQDFGRIGFEMPRARSSAGPGQRGRVRARAAGDLRGAVPHRRAAGRRGLGDVLLQPDQRPAELPEPDHARRPQAGRRPKGFVVPDFGFAVRDPVAAALAGVDLPALPGAPARPDRRRLHLGADPGLPSGRHRPPDPVRDLRLGRVRQPAPGDARRPRSPRPPHQQVATQVAEAGTVLLKNDRQVLPLSGHDRSIALIGPTGDDAVFVTGGSAGVPLAAGQAITPLAGITARAAQAGVNVTTVQGSAGDVASPTLVPSSVLTPSSGTGPGLLGTYWSNGDFSGAPALTRVDPTVDLSEPRPRPARLWSAKWTGTLTPAETGLYRFTLAESGIATLKIAGQTFGPAYREATQFVVGPHYVLQGTVRLTAGQAGAGRDRLLEHQRPVQPGDPLRLADAVRSRASRPRWRPPARRTSRSCSPTTPRARAWTAPRCRCRATRTS